MKGLTNPHMYGNVTGLVNLGTASLFTGAFGHFVTSWASLEAQWVKNLPAMQETWVRSLGREDSPGEGKRYPLQYSGLENSMDCIECNAS